MAISKINIAVDGPAGSGKSSTFSKLAQEINYIFLDTGLIYRAFTWYCIKNNVNFDDVKSITDALDKFDFTMQHDKFIVDNYEIQENDFISNEVLQNINKITVLAQVRSWTVNKIRTLVADAGYVVLGRDITSVVLPNAQLKIYLTSSVETRAKRRLQQNIANNVMPQDYETIASMIEKRDYSDMNREIGPLIKTNDSWEINNDNKTIDEIVELVKKRVQELISKVGK